MTTTTTTPLNIPDKPPEGFAPLDFGGPFVVRNGPLYMRQQGGAVQLGFRVGPAHVNPMLGCHGGMLATFCDTLLLAIAHFTPPLIEAAYFPTVGLQIDYLAGAPLGAWVQGEGQILKATRSMVFIQAMVTTDGAPCVRTSGVFKIVTPQRRDDGAARAAKGAGA
jgi:acyl-coenzyme A thioesterase PaaI-like protein